MIRGSSIDVECTLDGGALRIIGHLTIGKIDLHFIEAQVLYNFKHMDIDAFKEYIKKRLIHELNQKLSLDFDQTKNEILNIVERRIDCIFGFKSD